MHKITIIGTGRVGETTAALVAQQELCASVVLIDIRDGVPQGTALDIAESSPLTPFDTRVSGSTDYSAMADSELVVITAGFPRKPGMSRSDVLESNLGIIDGIVEQCLQHAPQATLLLVTNPVDVLTYRAWKRSGWDRSRVIGQAGVLDAARMATFIAMETGYSAHDITTMVLGGHGDSMVPVPRYCTINGIPLSHFLTTEQIEAINERTRNGGAEVLDLRGNSSAYDAPAAAIVTMIDAIANDRRRILPSVCILDGEYGHSGLAMGVPCVLGAGGAEKIIELPLSDAEQTLFDTSATAIKQDLDKAGV